MDADEPTRTALAAAWPLFGLELRTDRLLLRLPTDADLLDLMQLARAGVHPPDEMPFGVAWSTLPSPAFEQGHLRFHWANRANWTPDDWELGLAVSHDGVLIGMQGVQARQFAALRTVHTGSWLGRMFQGQGHGKAMRAAVLSLAFDGLGALRAETEAYLDNEASNAVSRALGYAENGVGALAPEGVARPTQRFLMTAEAWRSRPRPTISIEGLEACRELFGV
jgi:RimJ/RimL family protein N-acetyltransferase